MYSAVMSGLTKRAPFGVRFPFHCNYTEVVFPNNIGHIRCNLRIFECYKKQYSNADRQKGIRIIRIFVPGLVMTNSLIFTRILIL